MKASLTIIPLAAAGLLFAAPAQATTQADLKKCKTALTEQGHFNADQHSLKFSHRKGNTRNRTVYLTLKDRNSADKQQVSCQLQRKDVIDLNLVSQ